MIVLLVKSVLRLLFLMPAGMPYWLAQRSAGLWMYLSPVKRQTAERNLQRCYPDLSDKKRRQLLRDSFHHYLCSILETGHNWYWPLERLRAQCDGIVGEELFRDGLSSGRGLVVLGPHFGAWEYLGVYLQQFPNMAIVYKPPANPRLEKALHERRRRGSGILIPATAAGLRQLYAHLRVGSWVGILPDQPPSSGQGSFAPFFGMQALTAALAPRLVQRTGCRVLMSVCERLPGGRYRVHFLPADEEIHSSDLLTALTALNHSVERCIAIDPAQYLWSYRRFKARPEGEPPFYA